MDVVKDTSDPILDPIAEGYRVQDREEAWVEAWYQHSAVARGRGKAKARDMAIDIGKTEDLLQPDTCFLYRGLEVQHIRYSTLETGELYSEWVHNAEREGNARGTKGKPIARATDSNRAIPNDIWEPELVEQLASKQNTEPILPHISRGSNSRGRDTSRVVVEAAAIAEAEVGAAEPEGRTARSRQVLLDMLKRWMEDDLTDEQAKDTLLAQVRGMEFEGMEFEGMDFDGEQDLDWHAHEQYASSTDEMAELYSEWKEHVEREGNVLADELQASSEGETVVLTRNGHNVTAKDLAWTLLTLKVIRLCKSSH